VVELGEIGEPWVVLVGDPDAVVQPFHWERPDAGMDPGPVVGDVAAGDLPDRKRLLGGLACGVVRIPQRPEDNLDVLRVGRPDGEADPVPIGPRPAMLLGAEPSAVDQAVTLFLGSTVGRGLERERAVALGRVQVVDLGRDPPLILAGGRVHDHSPVEVPVHLGGVELDRGPERGAAVFAHDRLHRGGRPVIGVSPVAVPAPLQADVPKDVSFQPRRIDELHTDLGGRATIGLGRAGGHHWGL
jgi:hypothetical protein